MIVALLIAASAATAAPAAASAAPAAQPINLGDIAHAIDVGRLDQARIMIGKAMVAVKGPAVDRLLADLAFASGNNSEALARYQQLLRSSPADSLMAERAGIAALRLGDVARATPLLDTATSAHSASWRAWNARGALADLQRDWPKADTAYEKAAGLAPDRAEIVNNQGWSRLLRGDWRGAVVYFERAASLDPESERVANNLELARAALATDLPARRRHEADGDWAARLNDAGMAAEALGDRQRAIAAFTAALDASGHWYDRAANNLQAASAR
jgi:Flp pilus assembly protein TadD